MRKVYLALFPLLLCLSSGATPPPWPSHSPVYSRPNIHGGYTYYSRSGTTFSRPNNMGGYTYYGKYRGWSRKNIHGGQDFYLRKSK